MGSFSDLTGRAYGRLRVLRHAGWYQQPNGTRGSLWRCLCDPTLGGCGAEMDARVGKLNNGHTRSCGCLQAERRGAGSITHGATRNKVGASRLSAEYGAWQGMRRRCYQPGDAKFSLYGARGIGMCDRWRDDFAAFLADMGARPSPLFSLDRIDVNGPYSPENCRWATQKEQQRNRRDNRVIEFRGEKRCIAEWAELLGIKRATVQRRLSVGWSVERALTEVPHG